MSWVLAGKQRPNEIGYFEDKEALKDMDQKIKKPQEVKCGAFLVSPGLQARELRVVNRTRRKRAEWRGISDRN